jgi:hypothetical protein
MGKVKAWLIDREDEAIADIGNHDNIDSWLMAHSQCDEETLREYWNDFQSDHADIVYE